MGNRLRPFEADRLRSVPLSYDEVGATLGVLPSGYHHLSESFEVGRGPVEFARCAEALMTWGVQRGAGLRVSASSDRVELGAVAVIRLGPGPAALRAPVRVVEVVQDETTCGFAYGTLGGHPESGEELFRISRDADDRVLLEITAFSRPASTLARVLGPVGRAAQRHVTRRYGRALSR